MSAIELLPCPFCGSRPIIREGKKGHCQLHGDPYQGIKVSCPNSGCAAWAGLEAGDIYNGGIDKAKDTAITAWNRRTDLSQASVAVALEAAAVLCDEASAYREKQLTSEVAEDATKDRWRGGKMQATLLAAAIRALITPAQHDALAAHVAAEVAKARAEWVGSHCKELTAADRAHVIAHLSYELEPVGKPPTWNQLAMEIVRLSNALAQIGAKP